MGWVGKSAGEVFSKSLDWKGLWKYYFLILGISYAFTAALVSLFIPFFISFSFLRSALFFPLMAAYLLAIIIWTCFITGLQLNVACCYLANAKISFMEALRKAASRIPAFFLALLIMVLLVAALLLVPFIPAVVFALSFGIAAEQAIVLAALAVLGFLASLAILIFLLPLLAMTAPVVFLENRGAIDSVKRAIALGRKEYFAGLCYLVLVFLIALAIAIAYMAIALPSLILGFPGIIIYIAAAFVFSIWNMAFSSLAAVKLYNIKKSAKAAAKAKRGRKGWAERYL